MKKRIKYTDEPMEFTIIPDFLPPPGQLRHTTDAPRMDYDRRRDALRMKFVDAPVKQRVSVPDGVVLEYALGGKLVAVVFRQASKRFSNPDEVAAGHGPTHRKPLKKIS
ncbi:MAG: DUF2283 domain-containing protein [Phycisphaerales bacterium]|nr:DUF2283 domain-containing protein [Phycisphaerales bacterium]